MILVVDDEPVFREAASYALEADGHSVVTAASAAEALEIVSKEEPVLILSDVRMPGMGGFEFREAYERSHPARSTPFVFMTSLGEPQEIVRGLDTGADDYLVKPVPSGVLRAKVRALLRQRRRWSAPSFRGDLSRFPFIKVLRFCEVNGVSGTVEFETPDITISLPFRAGAPVAEDPETENSLDRLYDATEGTFTIRSTPIGFHELSAVEAPPRKTARREPEETEARPMGRLSAVGAGGRQIQIQTEFVTGPKEQIITVAILDGRTLLKRTLEPSLSATRADIEAQVQAQHAVVETEVREKLATLAPKPPEAPVSAKERFDALFEAGFASYREGRYEEALESWQTALALFPADKSTQVNIEIVKRKLAHQSPRD